MQACKSNVRVFRTRRTREPESRGRSICGVAYSNREEVDGSEGGFAASAKSGVAREEEEERPPSTVDFNARSSGSLATVTGAGDCDGGDSAMLQLFSSWSSGVASSSNLSSPASDSESDSASEVTT